MENWHIIVREKKLNNSFSGQLRVIAFSGEMVVPIKPEAASDADWGAFRKNMYRFLLRNKVNQELPKHWTGASPYNMVGHDYSLTVVDQSVSYHGFYTDRCLAKGWRDLHKTQTDKDEIERQCKRSDQKAFSGAVLSIIAVVGFAPELGGSASYFALLAAGHIAFDPAIVAGIAVGAVALLVMAAALTTLFVQARRAGDQAKGVNTRVATEAGSLASVFYVSKIEKVDKVDKVEKADVVAVPLLERTVEATRKRGDSLPFATVLD